MRFLIPCLVIVVCGMTRLDAGEDDVKPLNLEKVNSEADEADPHPGPDGLYFASNRAERWEIFLAKKNTAGVFTVGKAFLASKEGDYRSPFIHQGSFYFAHNKVPDETLKDLKNFDLVRMISGRAPLALPGISEPEDELHPFITPAGKEFYFSRKTADGWMLFVANGPASGPIGQPKEVGFPAGYHGATLGNGGLLMYLQGPLDEGRTGIFHSKRTKVGGPWSKPAPVTALNHGQAKRGDMSPSLNAEGSRLYFVSDRPGGQGGLDIWVVPTKDLK